MKVFKMVASVVLRVVAVGLDLASRVLKWVADIAQKASDKLKEDEVAPV